MRIELELDNELVGPIGGLANAVLDKSRGKKEQRADSRFIAVREFCAI